MKGNDIVSSYSLSLYERRCFSSFLTPGTLLYRRIKEEFCHDDKRKRGHFSCLCRSPNDEDKRNGPSWHGKLFFFIKKNKEEKYRCQKEEESFPLIVRQRRRSSFREGRTTSTLTTRRVSKESLLSRLFLLCCSGSGRSVSGVVEVCTVCKSVRST